MSARGDAFHTANFAADHNQRVVEIIHRRADVARNQVEVAPDGGNVSGIGCLNRQVLFAWLPRREVGAPDNFAVWQARIHRNALVAGIAGNHIWRGVTDYSREHDYRGDVSQTGELRETRHVVIDDSAR